MSQKQVQTNQYNQAGMDAYNQMIPQAATTLGNYMQNPLQSSFFNQMLGASNAATGQQGQTQMANLLRNNQGMGGQSNPYLQSLMAQQGRATSGQMAQNFTGQLQNAVGNQLSATNMASGFKPLQTGQTQTTSGLGSWLPQLIGAGLGMAGGIMSGGASKIGQVGSMGSAAFNAASPFLGGFANTSAGNQNMNLGPNAYPNMPMPGQP